MIFAWTHTEARLQEKRGGARLALHEQSVGRRYVPRNLIGGDVHALVAHYLCKVSIAEIVRTRFGHLADHDVAHANKSRAVIGDRRLHRARRIWAPRRRQACDRTASSHYHPR